MYSPVHNNEIFSGMGDATPILSPCYAHAHAAIHPLQVIQTIQVRQLRQMLYTLLEVDQDGWGGSG
jgi:hypothetical protein